MTMSMAILVLRLQVIRYGLMDNNGSNRRLEGIFEQLHLNIGIVKGLRIIGD